MFYIRNLKLTNYKNYTFQAFEFAEKLNLIVGNNGLGKTNLLDAIYYSCFTKSYLSASDLFVCKLDEDFFRIATNLLINNDNQLVEVKYLKQEKKEILLNKSKVDKQADFIGKFPCVIITPDDNQLILSGSDIRRKFIDSTLAQLSSEYLTKLMIYNKVLLQRNALLKSFYEQRNYNKELLGIYNESLISNGQYVHAARKSFIDELNPLFLSVYQSIFNGNENVSITYQSDLTGVDYATLLKDAEQHDRNAQRTTKGIHTDDILFELNNQMVKKIGSQGQQKTFLLSLKLAQFELLKKEKDINPLLLLDDIFDKLDVQRINRIFQLINEDKFGQVFITDTNEEHIKSLIEKNQISNYKIIHLGTIQE